MKRKFNGNAIIHCLAVLVALALFLPNPVLANKASVRIDAPDQVTAGSVIKIVLHASHRGNNFIHHTNWLTVAINGKEVKRWAFGAFSKPESENFTRELTYTVTEPIEISAEANCNLHGSAGVATHTVAVKAEPSGKIPKPEAAGQ